MSSSRDVEIAVKNLIAEMKAASPDLESFRETCEIACIVQQIALPIIDPDAPPSFIPAIARATLMGAIIQHDRDKALARLRAVAA